MLTLDFFVFYIIQVDLPTFHWINESVTSINTFTDLAFSRYFTTENILLSLKCLPTGEMLAYDSENYFSPMKLWDNLSKE